MGAGHKLVDPEVGLRVKKNRACWVLFKSIMGTKLGPLPVRVDGATDGTNWSQKRHLGRIGMVVGVVLDCCSRL